ncbi:hypothetical protein, partial [Aeromonas caviae]|uniref:hypothetical protein n=1 Tax=Aeromonas caviae TaxID=648 RepID=UPI0025B663F1
EGGNINMMHGDSRVMVVVCLETASLPAPCLSTSTSPRSREEPFFTPANRARWGRYFNTLMLLYESAPHLSLIYQREANDHAEFNISTTLFQG